MQQASENRKSYTTLGFFKGWAGLLLTLTLVALIFDVVTSSSTFIYVSALAIVLTLLIVLRIVQLLFDRVEKKKYDYRQIEALFNLYHHLKPGVQLPAMRDHAGSPDFLNLILQTLENKRPNCILEVGSGISTMVISEWLLQCAPDCRHIALDHEKKYADLTRSRIRNPNTAVVYAPLKNYPIQGQDFQWYDLAEIEFSEPIDLLIVDGPPAPLGKNARLPALFLLNDYLGPVATIILDDAIRKSEIETAKIWQNQFNLNMEYVPLEKGAFVLERNP